MDPSGKSPLADASPTCLPMALKEAYPTVLDPMVFVAPGSPASSSSQPAPEEPDPPVPAPGLVADTSPPWLLCQHLMLHPPPPTPVSTPEALLSADLPTPGARLPAVALSSSSETLARPFFTLQGLYFAP